MLAQFTIVHHAFGPHHSEGTRNLQEKAGIVMCHGQNTEEEEENDGGGDHHQVMCGGGGGEE